MKNPNDTPRMKLVDGEEISIAITNVCRPEQVLVRLGANLVAGIYNVGRDSAVYLWKKDDNDVYQYIGDIAVYDNTDGSTVLQVVPANGNVGSSLEKKSIGLHREQVDEYARLYKSAESFKVSPPRTTKMKFLVGLSEAVTKE